MTLEPSLSRSRQCVTLLIYFFRASLSASERSAADGEGTRSCHRNCSDCTLRILIAVPFENERIVTHPIFRVS